ncbi:MAG: 30S ribosomal protein S9 [Verrucomicrobiales bacterium]|nr:30S ribosomal protein S9 [Verrucomicrobiales bacterium]
MSTVTDTISATGRRKTAVARVSIKPGSGEITINDRAFEDYFPTLALQNRVLHPLQVAQAANQFDISITTAGGGVTGQVDAIRLGIARALLKHNPESRGTLREHHLLTRDSRAKERKKSGQPGARKRFQFSKR